MSQQERVTSFELSYDGSSYSQHEMDAALLGKVLMSTASLLDDANNILNGDNSSIDLKVKAHQPGSFEILFEAVQNAASIDVLSTLGLVKAAGAGSALGTVMAVVEAVRGRTITSVTYDDRKAELSVNGEVITCSKNVALLATSPTIRKGFDKLIHEPLNQDGTSTFKSMIGGVEQSLVTKGAEESYRAPKLGQIEKTTVETINGAVHFTKVNFVSKSGWKVKLGSGNEVAVRMDDETFLEKVNKNITKFSKDDLFNVIYRIETKELNGNFKRPRYFIEKVERHLTSSNKKIL
ncbi:MAG: hypothetical protein WBH20_15955 [Oceanisphaera sp.]|uniref:hypothetical protein n=1 Tax=Oceanisphaera sp. TaxID=1929979 RepID=UPI003C71F9F7